MYKSENILKLFHNWDPEFSGSAYSIFPTLHFYANLCHVCLTHNRESRLKFCSGCKMISYCSEQHQKSHWPQHKKFCKIISTQLKTSKTTNIFDAISFADNDETGFIPIKDRKSCILQFMENKLNRKLYPIEAEMILFPKMCEICGISNPKVLVSCPNCPHANFCIDHKQNQEHEKLCHFYTLCCLLDGVHVLYPNNKKKECLKITLLDENLRFPSSLEDFIDSYCSLTTSNDYDKKLLILKYHSEYLTCSMTLSYVLKNLNLPENSKVEIHVIGQYFEEVDQNQYWELILYWLQHVKYLKIVFFVIDISSAHIISPICQICVEFRKKIDFEFRDLAYENYFKSNQFVQPTILVGLNFDRTMFEKGTKIASILKELNNPFIITTQCENDAQECLEILGQMFDVNDLCFEENPFSSLKCARMINELRGLRFSNKFLIYKKIREENVKIDSPLVEQQSSIEIPDYDKLMEKNTLLKNKIEDLVEKKKIMKSCFEKFKEDCLKDIEKIAIGFKNIENIFQEKFELFTTDNKIVGESEKDDFKSENVNTFQVLKQ